jgi:hypothetical protein
MSIDRIVFAVAGTMILVSLAIAHLTGNTIRSILIVLTVKELRNIIKVHPGVHNVLLEKFELLTYNVEQT